MYYDYGKLYTNSYQHEQRITASTLYIVPTPIGNMNDITLRALSVLQQVDLIAAEDTRNTGMLLQHYAIQARLLSLHDHNEQQHTDCLIEKLKYGHSIALVCDAGTPLINDPGYHLVRSCRAARISVVPLPGACVAIAALSAAGLSADRFCYEGFLPAKRQGRLNVLQALKKEPRTLIFYESTHRLLDSLQDMVTTWSKDRYVVLAREITKKWESIYGAPVGKLLAWVQDDPVRQRGEMVLIVDGYHTKDAAKEALSPEVLRTLRILISEELSLKTASALAAKIHGVKKNALYRYLIAHTTLPD